MTKRDLVWLLMIVIALAIGYIIGYSAGWGAAIKFGIETAKKLGFTDIPVWLS